MSLRLSTIYNGIGTTRFHCFRTLHKQNVGEHSAGVALLYDFLAEDKATLEGMRAALQHDLAEHKFGDMPAPIKRALPDMNGMTFREFFSGLEDDHMVEHGFQTDVLSPEDARWLKMADAADGAMYCALETQMGNKRMFEVGKTFMIYYRDVAGPLLSMRETEVHHFVWEELMKGGAE